METETRIGRGRVHFTAPLRLDGSVNTAAYGARWGSNWGADFGAATPALGDLRMPPGRFVGNAKGLVFEPQLSEVNVPDYTGLGEGTEKFIVDGVTGSLQLFGWQARNLVDALAGGLSVAAGGATTEVVPSGNASVEQGAMVWTRHAIDALAPVTVTPSWTAWTENVHWVREPFGVRLLQGFAGPANSYITLAYTKEGGATEVEALAQHEVEVGMVYAGESLVDRRAERADAYRCLIRPAETLQLISEGAAEIPLRFTLRPVRVPSQSRLRWFRHLRGEATNG